MNVNYVVGHDRSDSHLCLRIVSLLCELIKFYVDM
jgi:hypothetical protein